METMYEKVQAILARQLRVDPAIVTLEDVVTYLEQEGTQI